MFGQRLKQLRKSRGLTQEQLAEQLNIPDSTIRRYESVVDNVPRRERIKEIADFFEVSVDQLLGYEKIESQKLLDEVFFDDYIELSEDDKELVKLLIFRLKSR